jgi:hypothetical protein
VRASSTLLLLLVAALLTLGACAKKGEPQPPDKEQSSFPRMYPSR